ncbi:hypothetical protein [Arthrobacter sp. SAFR-014]|uniref:hypothetical protein n=1 Tax=unclassified Arthrobacter TaxID=235627 RepID=UPI003F7C0467
MVWIVTLLLAALGASLTDWIKPIFTEQINKVTETGDPVAVKVVVQKAAEDVSLASDVPLSQEDLNQLEGITVPKQAAWLEQRGGIVAGKRSLMVTVRGNRTDPVRVTNIRDASECASPKRGTLMRLAFGRGASVDSVRIGVNVGEPDKSAWWWDDKKEIARPYFPDKTITLTKNEELVLNIDLYPLAEKVCRAQLQMTVVGRDTEHEQQLLPNSQQVPIMDVERPEVERQYSHVYVGGNVCKKFLPASPGWEKDADRFCGPGNAAWD